MNGFIPPDVQGVKIYYLIYSTIFFSVLGVYWLYRLPFFRPRLLKDIYASVVTTVFLLIVGCQVSSVCRSSTNVLRREAISNQANHSKMSDLFGWTYVYAHQVRALLPGPHSGRLITDFQIESNENNHMSVYRDLCFFLYPIDIRGVRGGETDCLIIFEKEGAEEFVPPGYRVIQKFDSRNIVAVKEKSGS